MPSKGLRWLSTEQPPFCPEYAVALLHTVILTKLTPMGISGY
jgi:hypothetical protein